MVIVALRASVLDFSDPPGKYEYEIGPLGIGRALQPAERSVNHGAGLRPALGIGSRVGLAHRGRESGIAIARRAQSTALAQPMPSDVVTVELLAASVRVTVLPEYAVLVEPREAGSLPVVRQG